MNIGLDYDGTITEDHDFWLAFYYSAKASGHNVTVITMRYPEEVINDFPAHVIYTSRKAKKNFCDEAGFLIDIWIDDNPRWLLGDSI